MSPDDLARLQASLDAAGDAIVAAHEIIEAQKPPVQAHPFAFNIVIDLGSSLDAWHSLHGGLMGSPGKTTLMAEFYAEEPIDEPLAEFVEHAVIGYLMNGDAVGLAKLNAAFPTEEQSPEVETPSRRDAGVYAPSLFSLNGRSLDSHNPWHLGMSFEESLRLADEEIKALSQNASSDINPPLVNPTGVASSTRQEGLAHSGESGVLPALTESGRNLRICKRTPHLI